MEGVVVPGYTTEGNLGGKILSKVIVVATSNLGLLWLRYLFPILIQTLLKAYCRDCQGIGMCDAQWSQSCQVFQSLLLETMFSDL